MVKIHGLLIFMLHGVVIVSHLLHIFLNLQRLAHKLLLALCNRTSNVSSCFL